MIYRLFQEILVFCKVIASYLYHESREGYERDKVGERHQSVEAIGDKPNGVYLCDSTDENKGYVNYSVDIDSKLGMVLEVIIRFWTPLVPANVVLVLFDNMVH